ncbi:MAG: KTSC domain-containing protein [Solirubrobacteraceae bacterium]
MTIVFAKGGTYVYEGVPEDVADQGSRAPSVGQWFLSEIKGRYQFRKQ